MIYEIHLYVPKLKKLNPKMLAWLFENGQSDNQPEKFWPVHRIRPKALARHLLRFDKQLKPVPGPGNDVELHYPNEEMGIVLYVHDRGVILFFPYMAFSLYSRVVLGICYTYISFLYDLVGFWSYDPQLDVISYGDDFQSIEETAILMERILPRQLQG